MEQNVAVDVLEFLESVLSSIESQTRKVQRGQLVNRRLLRHPLHQMSHKLGPFLLTLFRPAEPGQKAHERLAIYMAIRCYTAIRCAGLQH